MPDKKRPKNRGASSPTETPHHVADMPVDEADALDAVVKSPVTETGLPVEEQIRKEWDPKQKGGLSTSLRVGGR